MAVIRSQVYILSFTGALPDGNRNSSVPHRVSSHHSRTHTVCVQTGREKASSAGLRKPYLRVVGIEVDSGGAGRASGQPLTSEEEEEFRRLASRPDIYEVIAR